jgi:hypothetical protein
MEEELLPGFGKNLSPAGCVLMTSRTALSNWICCTVLVLQEPWGFLPWFSKCVCMYVCTRSDESVPVLIYGSVFSHRYQAIDIANVQPQHDEQIGP